MAPKTRNLILALSVLLVMSGTFVSVAFAAPADTSAPTTKLFSPIPGQPDAGKDLGSYLKALFTYGVGLAALLAMAQLIFGAVQYTTSAGAPSLQEDAKGRMRNAVVGMILLILSITILLTLSGGFSGVKLPDQKVADQPSKNLTDKRPVGTIQNNSTTLTRIADHDAVLEAKPNYKALMEKMLADMNDPALSLDQKKAKMRLWEAVLHPEQKEPGTNSTIFPGTKTSGEILASAFPADFINIKQDARGNITGYAWVNPALSHLAFQTALEHVAISSPETYDALITDRQKALRYNWSNYDVGTKEALMAQPESLPK